MNDYVLINATILDGTKEMAPQKGKAVFLRNGKITAITDSLTDYSDYEIIDLHDQYVMPGLINMHVHIPASGKPKKKPLDPKKIVRQVTANAITKALAYQMFKGLLEMEVMSGVTTIRTVGGILDFDSRYRDDIDSGKMIGPRIIASNMAISVPGGHMAGSLAYEATTEVEAAHYTHVIADSGADLIKLMITGGVLDAEKKGEPGILRMSPALVKAACEEAHSLGLKVAAHVEGPEGVRVALENGVDFIEHGAKIDDSIIKLFQENNACDICTISPAIPYAKFDKELLHCTEEHQYNGGVVLEGIIECAKTCLANNIPVGLGTDTGCLYSTHYDMWRELYYFHKYCNVSNAFALYTATAGNAALLGMEQEIGMVREGYCADLIVCKDNPLEDLQALRNISMVFSKGVRVNNSKLKKYDSVETELDKYL